MLQLCKRNYSLIIFRHIYAYSISDFMRTYHTDCSSKLIHTISIEFLMKIARIMLDLFIDPVMEEKCFNAVKAISMEWWFERNQQVFHNKVSS